MAKNRSKEDSHSRRGVSGFKTTLFNTALSVGPWESHGDDNDESNGYHLLSTYYASGT